MIIVSTGSTNHGAFTAPGSNTRVGGGGGGEGGTEAKQETVLCKLFIKIQFFGIIKFTLSTVKQ